MRIALHTSHTFATLVLLMVPGALACSAEARALEASDGQDGAGDASAEPAGDVVTQAQLEEWTATILDEIEQLREKEFPRPVAVSVSDAEKLREYVRVRTDRSTTPERRAADETLAKMLGCVPPDMDYEATLMELIDAQVGGFYDPDEEGFYLMEQYGGFLARTILSHELTHALDDQLYDIDGTLEKLEGNSDAQFAYHAVVEGSGTAVMNVWTMKHLSELGPKEMAELTENQPGKDSLVDALPYLWKPMLGVYMRGASFLKRSDNAMAGMVGMPKLDDFHAAFTSPPRSSEQVLHPEKYWSDEKRDEPIAVSFATDALPDGWTVAIDDTLGEFGWGLVLEPLDERGGVSGQLGPVSAKYTQPGAEGWGGDRYLLLANGAARVLVSETVWDAKDEADEFVAAFDALREHILGALARSAELAGASSDGSASGLEVTRVEDDRVRIAAWFGAERETASAVAGACAATVVRAR